MLALLFLLLAAVLFLVGIFPLPAKFSLVCAGLLALTVALIVEHGIVLH